MAKPKADITGPAKSKAQSEAFTAMISGVAPELQPLAKKARKLVLSVMPGCIGIVWPRQAIASFGTGPKKMTQHFCYVSFAKAHMNFGFYYGGELADPEGLLEGSGAKMRHVKIRDAKQLADPALRELVDEASTHRVPPLD
ncbi:MAG: DUF1801 domain-containing protein [Myxococcota bacterium]